MQGAFDLAGQFLDVDRPRNYPDLLLVEEPFLYGCEREKGHTYPLVLPPQRSEALLAAPVDKVRGIRSSSTPSIRSSGVPARGLLPS